MRLESKPGFDWRADLAVACSDREMLHHLAHFVIGLVLSVWLGAAGAPPLGSLLMIVLLAAGKEWLDALLAGLRARPIYVFDSLFDFGGWILAWVCAQAR